MSNCSTKIIAADADTKPWSIGLEIKLSKKPTLNIPRTNVNNPTLNISIRIINP